MIPPVNAAKALHRVLDTLSKPSGSLAESWKQFLQCPLNSPEFAMRHSEIVGLLTRIASRINSIENDVDRQMHLAQIPRWHAAIVFRDAKWSEMHANRLITQDSGLYQLATLGTLFDYQFGYDEYTISSGNVGALLDSLNDWLTLLDESPNLPRTLKQEIRAQVMHIRWLLSHSTILGSQPIVEQIRSLAGRGFEIVAAMPARVQELPKWAKVLGGTVAILASLHTGVDHTVGIVEGINELVTVVAEAKEQESLPPGEPKALPAGSKPTADNSGTYAEEVP